MVTETRRPVAQRLLDVRDVDPTILVDARYAGPDNVTGAPLPGYDEPLALLRPSAARALGRVQRHLRPLGLGLKVWDAYRPVRAAHALAAWAEAGGRADLLAEGYIARDSEHSTGLAVDVTLVDPATGAESEMGTPFDTFTPAAHTANAQGQALWNRQVLVTAMTGAGFANFPREWWHFRFTRARGTPLDLPVRSF